MDIDSLYRDIIEIKKLNLNTDNDSFSLFVKYIHNRISSSASTYFIADESKKTLTFHSVNGANKEELEGISFSYTGIAGWCAENKRPLLVKNIKDSPLFSNKVDYATKFKTRSVMAFPCLYMDNLLGVAEFVNDESNVEFNDIVFKYCKILFDIVSQDMYIRKLESVVKELSFRSDCAINNLSGGFIGVDNEGKIIFFNPKAMEILNIGKNYVGEDIKKLSEEIPELVNILIETLKTGRTIKRGEFVLSISKAQKKIGYSTINLKTVDGAVNGAGIIFQDITRIG